MSEGEIVFNHFNDVYHIHDSHLLARFSHALRNVDGGLTVFSGDAMSPSLESSVLKGEHIVPVLNHLKIDVACYGNHDFDFGEHRLRELSEKCNFPWVLSNAFSSTGELLASALPYVVLKQNGYKIGFLGLAGTDWPSNCQNLPAHCRIENPFDLSQKTARVLKEKEDVDFVVAVSHMRLEEDLLVAACQDVDIILGGHDHDIVVSGSDVTCINDNAQGRIRIIKSGTDFRSYSRVKVSVRRVDGKIEVQKVVGKFYIHSVRDLSLLNTHPEDPEIAPILASIQDKIVSVSHRRLFFAGSALDGRSSQIRNFETNLGNLLADAVRGYYNSDIAFVNSGSVRCDRIVPLGELTVRDIIDIVPFNNLLVLKRLSGKDIQFSLENSVSDARTDGRFLQISGLSFLADLRRAENSRIISITLPSGDPLSLDTTYTVAMTNFIADGFDGYHFLKDTETLVNAEAALSDTSLMLRIFRHEEDDDGPDASDMVERARNAIVMREENGLPFVSPVVEKRITFVGTRI